MRACVIDARVYGAQTFQTLVTCSPFNGDVRVCLCVCVCVCTCVCMCAQAALNLHNQREASASHYKPRPLATNAIRLRPELDELVLKVASNNHEHWCRDQVRNGWTYVPVFVRVAV